MRETCVVIFTKLTFTKFPSVLKFDDIGFFFQNGKDALGFMSEGFFVVSKGVVLCIT